MTLLAALVVVQSSIPRPPALDDRWSVAVAVAVAVAVSTSEEATLLDS